MIIQLKAKTKTAQDILKKHGNTFEVKDSIEHLGETAYYRIMSKERTNYFPFVGWRNYWRVLQIKNDAHFDFVVEK